jgi:hypothetical protein
MKHDRNLAALPVVAVVGLGAAFACTTGCTAYSTFKQVPIDCEVEKQYDLVVDTMYMFDTVGGQSPGWTAADPSPGALMTGQIEAIPGEPRCGSTAALVVRAARNNDWGSLFGFNGFVRDAGEYEGLAFWARAPIGSNTSFTMMLDDPNTSNPTSPPIDVRDGGVPPLPDGGREGCLNYVMDGGVTSGGGIIDIGTGMTIPGTVADAPEPDQCGNGYTEVVTVSQYWRLYTIPFTEFHQLPSTNRVPNQALQQTGGLTGTGLRPANISNLVLRMPKATPTELWIDNLGFYRKATGAAGGDGGVDAP